jgi:hypothetical protein
MDDLHLPRSAYGAQVILTQVILTSHMEAQGMLAYPGLVW